MDGPTASLVGKVWEHVVLSSDLTGAHLLSVYFQTDFFAISGHISKIKVDIFDHLKLILCLQGTSSMVIKAIISSVCVSEQLCLYLVFDTSHILPSVRQQHLNIFPLAFEEFLTDLINQSQSLVYRIWPTIRKKYGYKH